MFSSSGAALHGHINHFVLPHNYLLHIIPESSGCFSYHLFMSFLIEKVSIAWLINPSDIMPTPLIEKEHVLRRGVNCKQLALHISTITI